eukprot:gene6923-7701_t
MASAVDGSVVEGKVALITGITGQDGSYLAELLLQKNYTVHGIIRRSSSFNTSRIEHLYKDKANHTGGNLHLHYGDTTDTTSLLRIVSKIQPDEVYHLAAQSHVKVSFELSEYTANVDALGTLKLLEAIKQLGLVNKTKFYQASTSELYGSTKECPQNEDTPFHPRSPYGCAKLYAHWIVINYREAYKLFACNGILFNHESPRRGETFVTRKITRAVAKISLGLQDELVLGNLDAIRDWGHSKDYVKAMWLMLQQDEPDDFVIATGEAHTVREFVEHAFRHVNIRILWVGKGTDEIGKNASTDKTIVRVSERYYRPSEVDRLQGCPAKAEKNLNWTRKIKFEDLVTEMVDADLKIKKPLLVGYKGNIVKHQENSLEGIKELVKRKIHIHMEVRITNDEQIILFGDETYKRLAGEDVSTSLASYKHIKGYNLKKSLTYGNKTFKYEETAKIPLLEDVLNYLKGKGLFVIIEMTPSNAPPSGPADRYRSLRTGLLVGKLIRKLNMEDHVVVVSIDPFKLLALNHENSDVVTSWVMKKSFYETKTAERIRKEFVDLNSLRTCYIKTAPTGLDFIAFLLETGIVTKSVNGSLVDVDFELIDNPKYLSGRQDKTVALVRKNYNSRASVGAFLTYYNEDGSGIKLSDEKATVLAAVKSGVDRIITDDVDQVYTILYSVSRASQLNSSAVLFILPTMLYLLFLSL